MSCLHCRRYCPFTLPIRAPLHCAAEISVRVSTERTLIVLYYSSNATTTKTSLTRFNKTQLIITVGKYKTRHENHTDQ